MGPTELSLMIEGQEGVTWPDWLALAHACEAHGIPTLFRSDHYMNLDLQHPEPARWRESEGQPPRLTGSARAEARRHPPAAADGRPAGAGAPGTVPAGTCSTTTAALGAVLAAETKRTQGRTAQLGTPTWQVCGLGRIEGG